MSGLSEMPRNYRIGFFAGVVLFFAAHGFQFVHIILNEDGLLYFYGDSLKFWRVGRWMADVYSNLFESFTFPILFGIIAASALAGAGCLNAALWRVKGLGSIVGIVAVYAAFPAFANAFTYQFMAPVFALSCFFAVAGVYLVRGHGRGGFWLGCGCLVLTLAGYQAFICLVISLCLITVLLDDRPWGTCIRFVLSGIVAGAVYLLSVRLVWALHPDEPRLVYKGVEHLGWIPVDRIPELVARAYQAYARLHKGDYWLMPNYLLAGLVGIEGMLVLGIGFGWRLLGLLALPLAVFAISIFAPDAPINIMGTFGFIGVLAGGIFLSLERWAGWRKLLAVSLIVMTVLGFVNRSNAIGLKAYLKTESAFSMANRVLARLEEVPEFGRDGYRVAFVGHLPNERIRGAGRAPYDEITPGFRRGPSGFGNRDLRLRNFELTRLFLMEDIVLPYRMDDFDMAEECAKGMPTWPDRGAVSVFGRLIVVNFGQEAQYD